MAFLYWEANLVEYSIGDYMIETNFDRLLAKVSEAFDTQGVEASLESHAIKRAIAYLMLWRNAQVLAYFKQQNINTAQGEWLDNIGSIRGIPRLEGEGDDLYRARLRQPPINVSVAGYYQLKLKEKFPLEIGFISEVSTTSPNIVVYVLKEDKTPVTTEKLANYNGYLKSAGVQLINDVVSVQNMSVITVDITATVYVLPNSPNLTYFQNTLMNWFKAVIPGQDIYVDKIKAVLGGDVTVSNVSVTLPSTDVPISPSAIAKLGVLNITIAPAV